MEFSQGRIESLQISLHSRQPMKPLRRATAIQGAGLEGCRHSKFGNERAVLMLESETLEEFDLTSGQIKENISTRDINLMALKPGSCLKIGKSVILEVCGPCAPCGRMDELRPGLQRELCGRRGINCKVIVGGNIELGDPADVIKVGRALP